MSNPVNPIQGCTWVLGIRMLLAYATPTIFTILAFCFFLRLPLLLSSLPFRSPFSLLQFPLERQRNNFPFCHFERLIKFVLIDK